MLSDDAALQLAAALELPKQRSYLGSSVDRRRQTVPTSHARDATFAARRVLIRTSTLSIVSKRSGTNRMRLIGSLKITWYHISEKSGFCGARKGRRHGQGI